MARNTNSPNTSHYAADDSQYSSDPWSPTFVPNESTENPYAEALIHFNSDGTVQYEMRLFEVVADAKGAPSEERPIMVNLVDQRHGIPGGKLNTFHMKLQQDEFDGSDLEFQLPTIAQRVKVIFTSKVGSAKTPKVRWRLA